MCKIKYVNNPHSLESKLNELNKREVFDKKLHAIKKEFLLEYTGDFEMVDSSKIGDYIPQTYIRCRNVNDFESYII